MIKNYFILSFFALLHSSIGFSQSSFEPELWLYNPTISRSAESSKRLNFKRQISSNGQSPSLSSRKLNSSGHLFVVYKSRKNENLLSLIGPKRAVFLEGKQVKLNDSIDTNGYNESYGELLDIRYGGMENGRFWMNPRIEESGIFEVVLIDKQKSTRPVNEIRTYLGLKYGINLIDHKDYIYNDKELWDGRDKTYNHDIFGVARMAYFNLEPDKSIHSKDQDVIISVSKQQKAKFEDGAYVLLGNNRQPFTFDRRTKLNQKKWQVQTNKEAIRVDFSFPLSKLGSSEDSFKEYELLVTSNAAETVRYTGRVRDTLLVFRNVAFSNTGNSIIQLKEHRSNFKLETENDCNEIRLKLDSPFALENFRLTVIDDQGKKLWTDTEYKKNYTIANTTSSYFDITLEYKQGFFSKRINSFSGTLRASDLKPYYALEEKQIEIRLENPQKLTYSWFKDKIEIANGNNITINTPGNYELIISNSSGCEITQSFNVGTSYDNEQWRVYPNPLYATDDLQVAFDLTQKSSVEMILYQNDGKQVKTFPLGVVQHDVINLGALNLASGVYVLVAYINEIPQIKKIIIK